MAKHQWFYRRGPGHQPHGPLTARQLVEAVEAGQVLLQYEVSSPTATKGRWHRVSSSPELREAHRRFVAKKQQAASHASNASAPAPAAGANPSATPAAQPVLSTQTWAQDRVIRVFVSSTFRDMFEEREELVKQVFPQLARLCGERDVAFTYVDLRWGITDEETAEGKVLPTCLAEIERCRPFFIGLLGERYGWVPETIPEELIEREPWLAEHRGKSITELEIIHGVLNDPAMANRACFYFRDPAYIQSSPPTQQARFTEAPTPEEIERYGPEEAQRRAEERRGKLAALKRRIRQSGVALRENYPDPRTLGQWVLRDLTVAINQQFPPESKPDPLDREAAGHQAFARSRLGVYIGRHEYFERLDEHVAGRGNPLVVLGESGGGKSALLANWIWRHRQAHPDDHVIAHFVGASAYSSD